MGSGNPRREFMHVDDAAAACLFLMQEYEDLPLSILEREQIIPSLN
jgi:nucleoside-diphosphate-sugar epimerase